MQPASWWQGDSEAWCAFAQALQSKGEKISRLRASRVMKGLSNSNWRLIGESGDYFLQFLYARADHIRSSLSVAQLQAIHHAPQLQAYLPSLLWCDEKTRLFRWVDGCHPHSSIFSEVSFRKRVVEFVARLHTSNLMLPKIDLAAQLARYREHKATAILESEIEQAESLIQAFKPTVCAHNDLSPQNVLCKGNDMVVIDWEYAGLSDPAFEWAALFHQFAVIPSLQQSMLSDYHVLTSIDIQPAHLKAMAQLYQLLSRLWFSYMALQHG